MNEEIMKELDAVLSSIRKAEQNIIGMDAPRKMQVVERLIRVEESVKAIQKNMDEPSMLTKDTSLEGLHQKGLLSARASNTLSRNGCHTIADVLEHTNAQIGKMRNMGPKIHEEIIDFLESNGFEVKI